jgi:hypothetical protein
MIRTTVLISFFVLYLTASVHSTQQIALSGKVTNSKGSPIAGAIVKLSSNKKAADTTDAQGAYSISLTIPVKYIPVQPKTEGISLDNSVISIRLIKAALVGIELFDMKGNLLEKALDNALSAGTYRFDVLDQPRAANMMIIRVSINGHVSTFRYLPLRNGSQPVFSTFVGSAANKEMAKIQVTVDSLKASAPGFTAKGVAISSYQGTYDFTLDSAGLGKFSFFVTSLQGIRDLSKNPKGFGGDLRMGKTGQGAGLLGADSICQCLAEKSMPGSKAKGWRAFLSVTKDATGKQVNAIDRIGEGPWYDRLGRIFAKTKADLVRNRPIGIDTLIKNDLPNEFGVPNHKPDPNKPEVDNHLTVTGSDSTGKLFSATSTCLDWTSNTDTINRPRCGLSWTRQGGFWGGGGGFGGGGLGKKTAGGMGGGGFFPPFDTSGGMQIMTNMENWISTWTLPGCLAGVDSLETTMAGKIGDKSIGAGGGYGGFYCFGLNP